MDFPLLSESLNNKSKARSFDEDLEGSESPFLLFQAFIFINKLEANFKGKSLK